MKRYPIKPIPARRSNAEANHARRMRDGREKRALNALLKAKAVAEQGRRLMPGYKYVTHYPAAPPSQHPVIVRFHA